MPSSEDFEEILTTHLNDMYALAYQLTGSKHNAEDLVQDLFINLSMRRYKEREIERPKAWLATILYRTFIDQWRRQKRSPVIYGVDENHTEAGHQAQATTLQADFDPELYCDRNRQQELALSILQQLNERQRQIVILHDMHEYTMSEISTILDLPIGTIKSNLHRARKHIAVILHSLEKHANPSAQARDFTERDIKVEVLQESL